NEQSTTGAHLALATFSDLQALRRMDGGMFHAAPNQTATIGKAATGTLGRIVAGKVELSNIELSAQFTDMIVVQRGYQASSQVLNAANEMIQQLLETAKR